ncbi:uncharacterized protein LOC120702516 isoform X3 [Panicum virgatum]|uniref:uncharacterized protein LOC120702516 isoform X3 n=1 Tax=Panicum virgatum TaxID=38727 RepID=UPI0019D57E3C|nr:uncharacterized protein LOC120702516 isoform X3 [Panicum virgatum]
MNNSRTIERRAHHVHLTGWSHVLENLRVVCPLHFVCSSSLSRVSLSSPSALAAIAEIAPITHYRCAPLDPSVESAGFEVKIRPSSSSRAAGIRRERVLDGWLRIRWCRFRIRGWRAGSDSSDFCSYRLQIEGTVRTRGNESVPGLCSLSAAATLGVLHFQSFSAPRLMILWGYMSGKWSPVLHRVRFDLPTYGLIHPLVAGYTQRI